MPIYEYLCHSCGARFDRMQKFSDAPLETHEDCGGRVERLISAPALQFKGAGWYVNDYAKGSTSKPAETKTETKAESKSESKTESKPAATTTTTTSTDSK